MKSVDKEDKCEVESSSREERFMVVFYCISYHTVEWKNLDCMAGSTMWDYTMSF